MNRVKNIAKLLILLTTILLLAGTRYAQAQNQNTGEYPYRASEHAYQVPIGRAENLKTWAIVDSTDNSNEYNLKEVSWATVDSAETNGTPETVEIFFTPGIFTVGSVWYLRYREDQIHNDSITCVAARELKITIVENTFYLQLEDDISVCNSQSGLSHTYSEIDTESFETEVTYTVIMHKAADFDINRWEFDAIFDTEISSLTTNVLTSGGGTVTTLESTGDSIHFTVAPVGTGFPDTVAIELTVTHLLPALTDSLTSVDINNGIARSDVLDGAPWVYTDDNIQSYPISAIGDRNQAATVFAIPGTRDISPGGNDNTASAQNPLQNSTHTYVVEMADTDNDTNAATGWMIVENEIDGDTMTVDTHYSTTGAVNGQNDSINITFNSSMPEGDYILYYTEQNDNGCTTIRSYPFTLGGPFDVDIADNDRICPGISDLVSTYQENTVTQVDYVVNLNSSYSSDWSFDFEVSIDESPTPAEFKIDSIKVVDANGNSTYTSATPATGKVDVTYNEATPTTSLIMRVYYSGYYPDNYTITAALSSISGAFGEIDENVSNSTTDDDTEDYDENNNQNNTIHHINPLPQPMALEGVD